MQPIGPLLLSACLLSSGCASIPPVRVSYYPALATTTLTVTQVIACNGDGSSFTVTTTPDATTAYDPEVDPRLVRHFSYNHLDSSLADTNVLFKLADSARLLGVNSTATGDAQAVVAAGLAVGTAASTASGAKPAAAANAKLEVFLGDADKASGVVCGTGSNSVVANGKEVTIKYSEAINHFENGTHLMKADGGYASVNKNVEFNKLIFKPELTVSTLHPEPVLSMDGGPDLCPPSIPPGAPLETPHRPEDPHTLCLRPVQISRLTIRTDQRPIWTKTIPVPSGDVTMAVPVPESPLFGKLTTTVVLGDSGALEQIGYDKTSGASSILLTLAAIITFGATR